jgi:hypothetical protein
MSNGEGQREEGFYTAQAAARRGKGASSAIFHK